MSELPHKLAKGEHKVVISAIRDSPLEEFKAALERNYVHVKFTETKGGTELGFYVEKEFSDFSKADLDKGEGELTVAGTLKLDGVPVRCVATVELAKMEGKGHLEILTDEEYEEARKKHAAN